MKKTFIVTGAAGFLGSVVCRQLVEQNQRVRALVLPNDHNAQHLPSEVEIFEGDVTDINTLKPLFDVEADQNIVVLHIASIVTVNPNFSTLVFAVNVNGTQNIIEMCRRSPRFEKLVYCGSTGSIIETKGEAIAAPERYEADKVMGCYSQSKALAAQLVIDAANTGLNATVVHPTGIFGPEDFSKSETTSTLIKIICGEMPMGIAGTFNLVDVRDLAAGIIAAADKGRKGESYILGNEAVSFREFARLIAKESGCKAVKMFLPLKWADALARKMEKKAARKGTKPMMTSFSVYNLARNNEFDSSKAATDLGFSPRPYSDTIHDQVAWLKQIGWI